MRNPRITTILAVAICPMATALSLPVYDLFQRASTCADTTANACTGSGLPSNFCCSSGSHCIVLASNTTLLCCPNTQNCKAVSTIECNLQAQNITANPTGPLHTTNLDGTLPKCGSSCCPYGYSCSNGTSCVLSSTTSTTSSISTISSATATSRSSSTSATIFSITTSISAGSVTAVPSSKTTSPTLSQSTTSNAFPARAILAGFFPGLAAGLLIALAIFCLLGARRRKRSRKEVSQPIPDPRYPVTTRTDFLRRPGASNSSSPEPDRMGTVQRVKSLFGKSSATVASQGSAQPIAPPMPTQPDTPTPAPLSLPSSSTHRAAPAPPGNRHPAYISGLGRGRGRVQTSRDGSPQPRRLTREPSSEEINVGFLGPPRMGVAAGGRDSTNTTCSEMMQRAGVADTEKFVPGWKVS
jgi:hypothetical protein